MAATLAILVPASVWRGGAPGLSKRSAGRTLYILNEPTTGLHFDDIEKLLRLLDRLVEGGNTVVVIEHNLDVIKTADYVIDMGPEGGEGGRIVGTGTPEEVAAVSYTGQFLAELPKVNGCRRVARKRLGCDRGHTRRRVRSGAGPASNPHMSGPR